MRFFTRHESLFLHTMQDTEYIIHCRLRTFGLVPWNWSFNTRGWNLVLQQILSHKYLSKMTELHAYSYTKETNQGIYIYIYIYVSCINDICIYRINLVCRYRALIQHGRQENVISQWSGLYYSGASPENCCYFLRQPQENY